MAALALPVEAASSPGGSSAPRVAGMRRSRAGGHRSRRLGVVSIAVHRGAMSPLMVDDEIVRRVRTRCGFARLSRHAAWRTGQGTAARLVLETSTDAHTPAPLSEARRLARTARAVDR